ncbi:phosphoribosylaminoimidazolesuccinocarboxamide synthase [Candidatus Haliotispira prima]|uniref:Phosphoribosylaminoimidazole-succinocarboxamide synthase n=1 Tax=Candidatus Haliotispira prima TaxID=3034016 RepID=A0ABY8MI84_9SPIO|nr:phosphoribosylaminoimidazolesuccinocarboxamide synthase [Candidatus Haliotispira prima]
MAKDLLYEGKAKKIYSTDDPNQVLIYYKDDATAYNGAKAGNIAGKGEVNNNMSALLYGFLENSGIATHFISKGGEREQLCHKVDIIPVEVIVRNLIAGSMAQRLNIEEGTRPLNLIYELCYKNDDLGDPLINEHHAVALRLSTYEELGHIEVITRRINGLLTRVFDNMGLTLVDYKLEFGRVPGDPNGRILLADEISPDTCRLWDKNTGEKMDKDRFRRDLGGIEEAYRKVLERVQSTL